MKLLEGKVVVVTSGNSGIGLATAKEFHANGAKVVISGRDRVLSWDQRSLLTAAGF